MTDSPMPLQTPLSPQAPLPPQTARGLVGGAFRPAVANRFGIECRARRADR